MALIECNECGREISDKAEACPGCGAPVSQSMQEAGTDQSANAPETGYYLLIADEQQGPFSMERIRSMLANGDITDDTLYAKPGMEDWQPLGLLPALSRPVRRKPDRATISLIAGLSLLGILGIGSLRDQTPYSADPTPPLLDRIDLSNGGMLDSQGMARANRSGETVTVPVGVFQRIKGVNRHKLAYQAATNIVNGYVVSPGTARYPSFEEADIDGARKLFRVKSYVDSENRAGALLRIEFDLYMNYDEPKEEWVSVKLTFDTDE